EVDGGFDGSESSLIQRDWENNECVLSGALGRTNDNTDNAYTVVYVGSITTMFDGATVDLGNANGVGWPNPQSTGGGLFVFSDAIILLENVKIQENIAAVDGGGIYVYSWTGGPSDIELNNCSFIDNSVLIERGSAICIDEASF